MKAVILAGGFGTRLSEETSLKPKPMVEIGGMPMLWHIMKLYSSHGINEFIICCGYKGHIIKEFFSNYYQYVSDITFDLGSNSTIFHETRTENWKVTLVDTGLETMTGGRLKRIQKYIEDETFCFTYGDGLSDVDIRGLINYHHAHKKKATLTAVNLPGRFGALNILNDDVKSFKEKPLGDGRYVNGGFFVLSKSVFSLIEGDSTTFESEPLEKLASSGELKAYHHNGFWKAMDTLRDKIILEDLWTSKPPWKKWD